MPSNVIEFTELEKAAKSPLDFLSPRTGTVYVVAITRDWCPACAKQKPKLERLAASLKSKHGDRVVFARIHVNYSPDSQEESLSARAVADMLSQVKCHSNFDSLSFHQCSNSGSSLS